MKQVFISYPRDNAAGQAMARMLYSELQKQQIRAFIDEESIQPGDRWLKSLKAGVADCKVMLSVISAASHDREWFEDEFNEAKKYQVLVIPVLAEDVEIPMQLGGLQAVSLYGEQREQQLERLLQTIRKTLGIDLINPLMDKAKKAKRTEAYAAAIDILQQVLDVDPKHAEALEEIGTLEQLNTAKQQGGDLLGRLAVRYPEVGSVFNEVAEVLNNAAKRPNAALPLIVQTKRFLDEEISAEDFISVSQSICQPKSALPKTTQSTDYGALAARICKGEVALFLGSDVAREYGLETTSEKQIAQDLAKQSRYEDFDGGLSSIAEYLKLHPGYGSSGLWNELEGAIQTEKSTSLYRLLAKTNAPLVLISSAYDDQLERCFQEVGKPYVELSSIVNSNGEYDIGHVVVSYSDQAKPDHPYLAEELPALKLNANYSIIYKLRGSCSALNNSELKRDALTVTESDYFKFARYAEKIIPSYLTSLLRGRGFLFVGFSPDSWEQRLMVNALLSKRNSTNASDECYTVGVSHDPLEAAYWQKQKVQHYDVNLPELDEHLAEVLS